MENIVISSRKRQHIGKQVGILIGTILAFSVVATTVVSIYMFYNELMSQLREECLIGTNVLSYSIQKDPDGDMSQLIDELKQEMGYEFTIFEGDTRAYTSLIQNGKRAVGTKMASEVTQQVLIKGEHFVGRVHLMEDEFLCSYKPTRDESDRIVGAVFCGVSCRNAFSDIQRIIAIVCLIGLAAFVVGAILVISFLRSRVSKPMAALTAIAKSLESGDFGLTNKSDEDAESVHIHNDEIGYLIEIFHSTINRLRGYIEEISVILEAVSRGDLTKKPKLEYIGDFISIRESIENTNGNLQHTVKNIRDISGQVSTGAAQMSSGAQALSQGAVEQASTIESLEGTMCSISQNVTDNAASAEKINIRVAEMSDQLSESNDKMQEMMQAMRDIDASSSAISKIVETIEDIAFQTNILSLNAAVEAARAGDAGKGFAVVADQVRNLAGQSAAASKSTTELIEKSNIAVTRGMAIAAKTAQQLVQAVKSGEYVSRGVDEIVSASKIQADSILDVEKQIVQISAVVQTNSATAEESAATSEVLSSQAASMNELVSMFRVSNSKVYR